MEAVVNYQLDLFHVQEAYAKADRPLSNTELYDSVAELAGIPRGALEEKSEIGEGKAKHSKLKRQIRWYQQTLKAMNLLQRVEGERGIWALANKAKKGLHEVLGGVRLVAYSTKLGLAVWSDNRSFFTDFNEPIHLCVTSPPYPLRVTRGYGNVQEMQWVDFITQTLEPIVKNLVPGGSVVLNVSNDIFESKLPSRSMYLERMVLALHDRLGLSLMDRWPWINTSKPPSPTQWACVNRVQLCSGWEPVYWFTNDPSCVRSDNRRVLLPHTDAHQRLMDAGGDRRVVSYGDGAYRLRGNAFGKQTEGRIPKNVIQRGHRCADTMEIRKAAKELGLPPHPAMFPTDIPELAIRFLTEAGDLVVDPFSGSNKSGLAAERNDRRWAACDNILEYIRQQAEMFTGFDGFWMNPAIAMVGNGGSCN
ncbi:site-specific DNA-methyltransferase (cytosine-N4-specific) [Aeromonas salmonicida]|uniref:Methyltransferase n=1 Tax=Aeromonas salmonicida TaxID=645 RepID=A0AAX1PDV9_AERSA|nr:site-specific DNA-methyltransferase (cytosine-N4-specific) [Aeromonas salmonicida]